VIKACIDCFRTKEQRETVRKTGRAVVDGVMRQARPAPCPGPRCATHGRIAASESKIQSHDRYVQRMYSMQPGEYQRLYEFQGGVCWICRRAKGLARKLAVDHDHKCCPKPPTCGKCTRGLVCSVDNKLLGHFRDDPQALMRAAEYLVSWPYRRMKEGRNG